MRDSSNTKCDWIFKTVCIFMVVTTLLPWFSISEITSPYYGFQVVFEHCLWIPFISLAICLCLDKKSKILRIVITEVSFLGIFGILIWSFLYFRRYMDLIFDGQCSIDVAYSFSCTLPAFWLNVVFTIIAFALLQYRVFRAGKDSSH